MKKTRNDDRIKLRNKLRRYLVDKQDRLMKRQRELTSEDPFSDRTRLDDNAASDTDAWEEAGHDRITAIREESERTLVRVRKALTLMRLGKWGKCEKCGKLIETDRLIIEPTATWCVTCQSQEDGVIRHDNEPQ